MTKRIKLYKQWAKQTLFDNYLQYVFATLLLVFVLYGVYYVYDTSLFVIKKHCTNEGYIISKCIIIFLAFLVISPCVYTFAKYFFCESNKDKLCICNFTRMYCAIIISILSVLLLRGAFTLYYFTTHEDLSIVQCINNIRQTYHKKAFEAVFLALSFIPVVFVSLFGCGILFAAFTLPYIMLSLQNCFSFIENVNKLIN